MGEIPDWYLLVRAARYLGVAPWDLASQEASWLNLALTTEAAEQYGEAEQAKHQRKPGKGRKR